MGEAKEIKLTEKPDHKEFEEFVSSYFHCAKHYVEHALTDRKGGEELLELDVFTTKYSRSGEPELRLVEAKSGGWGFNACFKVSGWMNYLNVPNGCLIVSDRDSITPQKRALVEEIGLNLIYTQNTADSEELKNYLELSAVDENDLQGWRYAYWIRRNILELIRHKCRSHQNMQGFRNLKEYYYKVNSSIFFERDIISRLENLYEIYRQHPHISAKCTQEVQTGIYDDRARQVPQRVFEEAYQERKFNNLALTTFVEHRARLSILKNAIDFKIYKDLGDTNRVNEIVKILGQDFSRLNFLPDSFRTGLETISNHEYFHLYPMFWQWFLWVFGGLILTDLKDQEYQLFSEKTGIPVSEIENALQVYDILFPNPNGESWFRTPGNSNIKIIQMASLPFIGNGANYRRDIYTDTGKYEDFPVSGRYTISDLAKYNNAAYHILDR